MVTTDEIPTWAHRAILVILYLNKGKISKQKLCELLYLIYKELENVDPLEDLDFYINMKTKGIEIFTPDKDVNIDNILYKLHSDGLVNIYNDQIYLTDYGNKAVKAIMNDPEFKNEVDTIISVVSQYKDFSEEGLINLILENLKRS
ncbi:MAG: hypothetical protein NV1_24 [Nanoarchaeotal virus 1]|nr:MAG: hypothetical protein NV1_24 [Nanoarchaeotal virus 1]